MTRIIKIDNTSEEKINEYLEIMQKDLQATIVHLQCYGANYDCYMIVYKCEKRIILKDILDREMVPLD